MKSLTVKNVLALILLSSAVFINKPAYAVFQIGIDNYNVDFGFMNIGESKELNDRGAYHNEITCRSDNARTWYLKIQTIEPLKSGSDYISAENFRWKIVEALDADGIIYNKDMYNAFSDFPSLAYTCGPNDPTGREVKIRFRYNLSIPKNQVAGNYRTIIRYTLTEIP